MGPDRKGRAALTLGSGLIMKLVCFVVWLWLKSICSLHSHTFSEYIPLDPAECADAIKTWFRCVEEISTADAQSLPNSETSLFISSIAKQVKQTAVYFLKLLLIILADLRLCRRHLWHHQNYVRGLPHCLYDLYGFCWTFAAFVSILQWAFSFTARFSR